MYLIDTNIFLEILLKQDRSSKAKEYLASINEEQIFISDFSVYSIGIILNKLNRLNSFELFLKGIIIDGIPILSLSSEDLLNINIITKDYNLDFDDAYQYLVAKKNNLNLVTFDSDFQKTDLSVTAP